MKGRRETWRNCLPIVAVLAVFWLAIHLLKNHVGGKGSTTLLAEKGSLGNECTEVVAGLRNQIASLMKSRVNYGELYCEKHGIGPTGGFCVKSDTEGVGGNNEWDQPTCTLLADVFAEKTVLDIGCGLGWYGKCLNQADKNVKWTGLDGSEGIEKATGRYQHNL